MSSEIDTIPLLARSREKKASSSDGRRRSSSSQNRNSRRPRVSKFTQQELPACKPALTPGWVIATFTFIGTIFIPIGLATLFASQRVVEIVDRYDIVCIPENLRKDKLAYIQSSKTNKTCTRTLTVPKHMKSPIYVYYQLDDYFQNHRHYVRSRSNEQLRYRKSENDTSACDPEGNTWNGSAIVPCGLTAWSLFNDTYHFALKSSKVLEVNKNNISWKSDQDGKFGDNVYPKNFQSGRLIGGARLNASQPLSQQEDLIVWMRLAAMPTFRKLYGKIEVDLEPKEKITVVIQNNYNTYSFGGKKKLVLSTTSWIGGKNDFLGIAYVTVGGLCIFFALIAALLCVGMPTPEEDPLYLSWNISASGYLNRDGTLHQPSRFLLRRNCA